MALKALIIALGAVASVASAANLQPAPDQGAPGGSDSTRYCLRVDPATGSRMETVQCRTRWEWTQLQVDVDSEWADNGVRTLG